jgi:RNA polymerase sigma-70 factor (ECF subfamily)
MPGALWAANGRPVVVFAFTVRDDKVTGIELVADPERLAAMKIETLG